MTRNLCRHADKGRTGHACTSVIGARATQGAVFANNRPVLRRGDPAFPHTILVPGNPPRCVGHRARVNRGSGSVFCQGIPVARVGDSFDRGRMIQGSANVFAGG
jgi:uncharacterized Zn-binding protein involved in type VI secretion